MVCGVTCDKSKIVDAIYKKEGIIERAAKSIGIAPTTIYEWIKKDEDVANAVKEAREYNRQRREDDKEDMRLLAFESAKVLLKSNDVTTTIFTLKSLDKWSDKAGDEAITSTKIETIDYSKAGNG